MLTIFAGLPRTEYEQLTRILFERLNFAAVSILERPMAQMYATGAMTGVVIDIGRVYTEVTPVYDGAPVPSARAILPVGSDDCEHHLAHIFRQNTAVMSALSGIPSEQLPDTLLALAKQAWQEGLVRVGETSAAVEDEGVTDIAAVLVAGKEKAVIESGMKKRANAKASAAELARAKELEALDLTSLTFRGQEITLGKERHRFCDPLFHPSVLQGVPPMGEVVVPLEERISKVDAPTRLPGLDELVGHAVGLAKVDERKYIYEHLFVTGEICSQVKGNSGLNCAALVCLMTWYRHWPHTPNSSITFLGERRRAE